MTEFKKPPTSITKQISMLESRGMVIKEEDEAERWLKTVSYYRLGAYWLPQEQPPETGQQRSRVFKDGTTFESITDLYILDRHLRLLVMEAIDRIEIAVRTIWTYQMVGTYGSHPHCNKSLFNNSYFYEQAISRLTEQVERSGELFIKHYKSKYESPELPPLWMATELMSFGDLSKWIDNAQNLAKTKMVAKAVGLPSEGTFRTVLQVLVNVRNHCAHHGRLWNRRLITRPPLIKSFGPDILRQEDGQPDNRVYNVLVIITRLLEHQSPKTKFRSRLGALVAKFSEEQLTEMGFPKDWKGKFFTV